MPENKGYAYSIILNGPNVFHIYDRSDLSKCRSFSSPVALAKYVISKMEEDKTNFDQVNIDGKVLAHPTFKVGYYNTLGDYLCEKHKDIIKMFRIAPKEPTELAPAASTRQPAQKELVTTHQ